MEKKKDFIQWLQETMMVILDRDEEKARSEVPVVDADPEQGLSKKQVKERTEGGWAAGDPKPAGRTGTEIVVINLFTFFNLVFVVLAVLLMISGSSFKNMTFLLVAAANTVVGIYQEIKAKRAVDRMILDSRRPVQVVRRGKVKYIPARELVRDDIVLLGAGDVVPADLVIRTGSVKVDESLITGESEKVLRALEEELRSGGIVREGRCRAQVIRVGADAYAAGIAREAKANPSAVKSAMMTSLDRMVHLVAYSMIPLGILLFFQSYNLLSMSFRESVEGTVAALVGMIPEGLYLLTSTAMFQSAWTLSRNDVLVQDLYCVESLARVDMLCLDKTGTITENEMKVEAVEYCPDVDREELKNVLYSLYSVDEPDNDTGRVLAGIFGGDSAWICDEWVPFSSDYKWCGGVFRDHGAYVSGAPELLLGPDVSDYDEKLEDWAGKGYRVVMVAAYEGTPEPGLLDSSLVRPMAFCLLTSPVRKSAEENFRYFQEQGVTIRVLSGDNALTVSQVAESVGIPDAHRYVDAKSLNSWALEDAAQEYTVFGRVTPEQKRALVAEWQQQGYTVAMVGDGVNDLLAMKQADCSVAMASGADAACQMADLVLQKSEFSMMPAIVQEGRRVINNIQRTATLFLVKNIFSILLAVLSLLTVNPYPFKPIHMTLIAAVTIGIPAFLLTMEPNDRKVEGKFLPTVLRKALPGGLADVLMVLIVYGFAKVFALDKAQISTICAGALAVVGMMCLYRESLPMNRLRRRVWAAMAVLLALGFLVVGPVFDLTTGTSISRMIMLALLMATPTVYNLMRHAMDWLDQLYRYLQKIKDEKDT